MSCEILYLTGVVQETASVSATVFQNVPLSGSLMETAVVDGRVTAFVLYATVQATVSVTGKCRQA
jgi:hypothetical protein